jgi:hypothetical protein
MDPEGRRPQGNQREGRGGGMWVGGVATDLEGGGAAVSEEGGATGSGGEAGSCSGG